jgi:hypothetical protein
LIVNLYFFLFWQQSHLLIFPVSPSLFLPFWSKTRSINSWSWNLR